VTAPDQDDGGADADGSRAAKARNLTLRVASAAVLAPVVLASAYIGGWLFFAVSAVAAGGILWEWAYLIAGKADPRLLVPGWTALFAALVLTGLNAPDAAIVVFVASAVLAGAVVAGRSPGGLSLGAGLWAAGGVAYAGAAFFGPALLRRDPQFGFTALLFLFAVVWSTDIAAFFCGRAIGGPRLWPRVSPNKTWSGAVAGLAGGLAAGAAVAYASGLGRVAVAGVMGFVLSGLAQAGDLLESAVKRHFNAKDTSGLIPGHGGLMDRLDSFLVAALAALVIGLLRQGMDAPGRGLLLW
jgi:phosphatidate cytidylyltransferase